jgi:hypothetical protein
MCLCHFVNRKGRKGKKVGCGGLVRVGNPAQNGSLARELLARDSVREGCPTI